LPPGEDVRLGMEFDLLGRSREEGAESDIIGPRLARFHRQMPAVVAGDADLGIAAKLRARIAHIAVGLAEMHAIGADAPGEADRIVDDESNAALRADALQRLGKPRGFMLVDALDAELEGGDRPG